MTEAIKTPTDRSCLFYFAAFFALLGSWLLWHSNRLGFAVLAVAAVFGVVGALVPKWLHLLNVVWTRFGLLLNKIVSPIVLGAIFVVVFVPVSLLFRLIGRDALKRTFESGLATYWVDREPPGPEGASFPRQF